MAVTRALVAALCLCALAACTGGLGPEGGSAQSQFAGFDEALAGALRSAPRPAAAPASPPRLVILDDPAPAEAPRLIIRDDPAPPPVPGPLLAVEIPARGTAARLVPSGQNGAVTTWRSVDAVSLSLRAPGVLVASRGLGEDLVAADAAATAAALSRAAPGPVQRRHRSLDGNLVLGSTAYDCALTLVGRERIEVGGRPRDTLRFQERCTDASGGSFLNTYWRDAAGPTVRQSEQWVGPDVGVLRVQRIGD
jgi:hypothetical protein